MIFRKGSGCLLFCFLGIVWRLGMQLPRNHFVFRSGEPADHRIEEGKPLRPTGLTVSASILARRGIWIAEGLGRLRGLCDGKAPRRPRPARRGSHGDGQVPSISV